MLLCEMDRGMHLHVIARASYGLCCLFLSKKSRLMAQRQTPNNKEE